jgi:tetratricopeptide (TPR) repeat protein
VKARWRSLAVLALAAQLGLSRASHAQATELERAKASFRAGANAYAAGDYAAAIQALEAAYELTPLPAIAFSLAQAERKQYGQSKRREHLERALALFRRYLEQEPDGARRGDAELAIKALEPELGGVAPDVAAAAKPQARPTRLMIVSDTPGASISLDGGVPGASPLIREVAPGVHRARVRARGHFEVVREVTAVAGELLLTEVHLREQPTSLYVWAPEDADVYVDGVYMGQGGGTLTVPLEAGRHQLSVAQKGKRLVRREFSLLHGQARTELVTLEPTVQRRMSELLFIGGGAAVGASLLLSAFAVRSENRAEDFLALTSRRAGSIGELVSYNASIVERNRYRTAAVISAAASVSMFVTGLFLRELDQPSSAGAPRGDLRRREARQEPALDLVPTVAGGDWGASLKVSF